MLLGFGSEGIAFAVPTGLPIIGSHRKLRTVAFAVPTDTATQKTLTLWPGFFELISLEGFQRVNYLGQGILGVTEKQ